MGVALSLVCGNCVCVLRVWVYESVPPHADVLWNRVVSAGLMSEKCVRSLWLCLQQKDAQSGFRAKSAQ